MTDREYWELNFLHVRLRRPTEAEIAAQTFDDEQPDTSHDYEQIEAWDHSA
jgi:hypothetical protein